MESLITDSLKALHPFKKGGREGFLERPFQNAKVLQNLIPPFSMKGKGGGNLDSASISHSKAISFLFSGMEENSGGGRPFNSSLKLCSRLPFGERSLTGLRPAVIPLITVRWARDSVVFQGDKGLPFLPNTTGG